MSSFVAADEEEKVRAIEEDVSAKQKVCEEDLAKAEPALMAAQAALDTLDKTNLTEYKSFGTPPPGTDEVAAAVMVLFAPKGKIPRMQDRNWKNCKVCLYFRYYRSTYSNIPKFYVKKGGD